MHCKVCRCAHFQRASIANLSRSGRHKSSDAKISQNGFPVWPKRAPLLEVDPLIGQQALAAIDSSQGSFKRPER
jgi:hypothetical protein